MSMLLTAKAFQIKVKNPIRKLILLKLADNANDFGECYPSFGYIAEMCECSRRCVIDHINALIELGLLSKQSRSNAKGKASNLYTLHLDPSENNALPSANTAPSPSADNAPPSANDALTLVQEMHIEPVIYNQSNNLTDVSQAKASKRFIFDEGDVNTAHKLFELVKCIKPNAKKPNFDSWANDIRLMREYDNKSHDEMVGLFTWANQDKYWQSRVLNPSTLRYRWDQLELLANQENKQVGGNSSQAQDVNPKDCKTFGLPTVPELINRYYEMEKDPNFHFAGMAEMTLLKNIQQESDRILASRYEVELIVRKELAKTIKTLRG